MDLSADNPEDTVMSFRVPGSEVRLLGPQKLICQTRYETRDLFRVYDIWGKRNPHYLSEDWYNAYMMTLDQ